MCVTVHPETLKSHRRDAGATWIPGRTHNQTEQPMSTDWRTRYADKVVTAAEAVKEIRRGNRVFIGSACGEPQALVRAMVEAGTGLADTEVVQILTLGVAP